MTRTRRDGAASSPGAASSRRKRTTERAPLADPVNAAHTPQNDLPPAPQPSTAPVRDPWLEACLAHHQDELLERLWLRFGDGAEDALQGALAKFDRIPAELRALKPDDPQVRAWLWEAARHQGIDHYRARESDRARIQVVALRGLLPVDLSKATPRDAARYRRLDCEDEQDADRQKAVAAALDGLADEQRSAIVEHHLEGRPVAEIAQARGICPAATYAMLHRTRAAVRSVLL